MPFQLTFAERYVYKSLESGITIPTALRLGRHFVSVDAKIDTGAQVCLYTRDAGEDLGIDIESGIPLSLTTIAGSMLAYGHEVTLETLGLSFQTIVYFSEFENLPRNLLGRQGWLRLVRLAIVDYDEAIYLSPYTG
ncbi:MAG: hypothetical protein AB1757_18140 [Acidobacteriota bacterium]